MLMHKFFGLFALIPTSILLTVSFFVLVVISRTEKANLRAFGYVITALLWVSSLLVFSAGIYTFATGRNNGMCMMQMQHGSMPMMMPGQMEQPGMKK